MSENSVHLRELGNPYKIVDHTREHRKGIAASSLKELINIARVRFAFPTDASLTVVLEQDGTEVDDEEYFATLEKNTSLMILYGNQKWTAAETEKSTPHFIIVDDTDYSTKNHGLKGNENIGSGNAQVGPLVSSVQNERSYISLLAGSDLEMLSDMNPDSIADMFSDKLFLEQLKEASSKFLADKRQAQESLSLLQMFSSNTEMKQT